MLSDEELLAAYREGFSPADPHSGLRAVEAAALADAADDIELQHEDIGLTVESIIAGLRAARVIDNLAPSTPNQTGAEHVE